MKKVKLLFFGLVVSFFLISLVSATDTEIKIKTLPYHEVHLTILDSSSSDFHALDRFRENADEYGDVSFIYSSDEYFFDLAVLVKNGEKRVISERFSNNYAAGEPIYLEVVPENFEIIETPTNETAEENLTINETEEINETEDIATNENAEKKEFKITGFLSLLFGDEGFFSKRIVYYGAGGVIVLLLIGFVSVKIKRKRAKKSRENRDEKSDEIKEKKEDIKGKKERIQSNKELIEDAERKIKEAQEEIRKVRNEDRITEAKKKIIEDERELMKLREGKE